MIFENPRVSHVIRRSNHCNIHRQLPIQIARIPWVKLTPNMPTGAGGRSGVGSLGGWGLSGGIVAVVEVVVLGVCVCASRSSPKKKSKLAVGIRCGKKMRSCNRWRTG